MTNKLKLQDEAARKLIRESLDESLLVEAAAGTGKTTLLIERILNLIIQKETSIKRIVAITFTEKAAGELKQRLRTALEARIQDNPAGVHAPRFRDALSELDLMPVNTIHGFCRELIRQLPIEAEVDPDVQVLDEAAESALKDEFWEEWLTQQLSSECEPLRPLFDLNIPLMSDTKKLSLRDLFDELVENSDTLDKLHVPADSESDVLTIVEAIKDLYRQGVSLTKVCSDPNDKLIQRVIGIKPWMDSAAASTVDELFNWLRSFKSIHKTNAGTASNWNGKENKRLVFDWIIEFNDTVANAIGKCISYYTASLISWLKGAVDEYIELKRTRGFASFQDLLVIARDMLHTSENARRYFKRCYDYLLIDEFQDTDPLQTEIIFYLAEEESSLASNWEMAKVEPGKLFIVGDPKQSIYRFRRADLDLYQKVKAKVERDGRIIYINVSFRSVQPIIEEVNAVFAPQMTGIQEERYEPDYVAMVPHRSAHESEKAIELLAPPVNWTPGEYDSDEAAQKEAAAIAEHIRQLVDSGMQISEKVNGVEIFRPLQWSDIAVLSRVWTNACLLEREFRARDIPFVLPTDRVFGARAEIAAMKTMLCSLDNPFDELNIVGALRSSLLGCSDDELLMHKSRGGSFNYQTDTKASGHLKLCFDLLRDLHVKKRDLTATELIDEIISATHNLALLALKPHGVYRIEALHKLIAYIRSLEDGGKRSISQMVRLLNQETFLKTIGESEISDATVNQVSILTYFKAKGLEFPVVVLYDLSHRGRESYNILYERGSGKLGFSMGAGLQTAGFTGGVEVEKERQQHEELRLLYVAMTRARDRLVLPLYWFSHSKTKPTSQQCFLEKHYPPQDNAQPGAVNDLSRVVDSSPFNLNRQPREQLMADLTKPFPPDIIDKAQRRFSAWQERHDAALDKLNRAEKFGTASGQKRKVVKNICECGNREGHCLRQSCARCA